MNRFNKILNNTFNLFRSFFTENYGERRFDAAKKNRLNQNWSGTNNHINVDIKSDILTLRARSRELFQNDPYVKKYCGMLEKYVVGPSGFTMRSKVGSVINNKFMPDKKTNYFLEEEFWEWSKKKNCTTSENLSLRTLLYVTEKANAIDGEIFIKKNLDPHNPWGVSLQLIEANLCDINLNAKTTNGNLIIMGIEYDERDKAVAYYFRNLRKDTPVETMYYVKEYRRIPADYIIHYYDVEFAGQKRGYPHTVQNANRLKDMSEYEKNALVNAKSAAMKVAVLVPKEGAEYEETTDINNTKNKESEESIQIKNVQPGETYVVPDGYTYAQHDPTYPQSEYGSFLENNLYGVASGFDVDYATLSSNLSKSNYVSTRHGAIDSRLTFEKRQNNLIENVLQTIYEWWLECLLLKNKMKGFTVSDVERLKKAWFFGFKPGWVDPLKDVKATIMELKYKLVSYEDVLAKKGIDITEHLDQLEEEKKMFESRGLVPEIEKFGVDNSDREAITEAVEEYMEDYFISKSNGHN